MKLQIMGIVFLSLILTSCSKNTIGSLFNEAKKSDEYVAFTIPKWVIRTVNKNIFDDHLGTTKNSANLLNHITKVRVFVQDDLSTLNINKMHSIVDNITERKHHEEYLTVRNDGKTTSIILNEKNDCVNDILLFTESDESLVLLHLKSDISITALQNGEYFKDIMR